MRSTEWAFANLIGLSTTLGFHLHNILRTTEERLAQLMAELLTVVRGIASFAQILGLVIKSTEVIVSFCSAVYNAPIELRRIKEKLLNL
ncbi:hypothetical protein PENSUB_5681 [Penicillium subrubescens]|uniref:Uncharacterized protein n=1 Tax=Penicillium subrubescens TaxID=1316194 RepID=A0A1Q5U762_9EURO|nr:hypothetical protein PENSUB_5681 [Penicillium subrubescens]